MQNFDFLIFINDYVMPKFCESRWTTIRKKRKKTIEESVKAIVVQAGSTYEKDNGNGGKETVQDVKVKILQGTFWNFYSI